MYITLLFDVYSKGVEYKTENLGEILRGDRISSTAYDVQMDTDLDCRLVCEKPAVFDVDKSNAAHYRIDQEYFIHLIVDNLPCATQFQMPDTNEFQYEPGFRLGFMRGDNSDKKAYINNHLNFILSYHHNKEDDKYRVVGFLVSSSI